MIFLVEYNRPEGRVVTFLQFDDAQRREAEEDRLDLELALHRRGAEHEVVLLEARDEVALRRTHRRYFEDLASIANSSDGADTF